MGETGNGSTRWSGSAGRLLGQDAALSVFLFLLVASTLLSWPLREFLPHQVFDVLAVVTIVFGVVVLAPNPRVAVVGGIIGAAVALQRVSGIGRLSALETAPAAAFSSCSPRPSSSASSGRGRSPSTGCWGPSRSSWCSRSRGARLPDRAGPSTASLLAGGRPANAEDLMWFSIVTISTVGYGDVLPATSLARALSALEALTGVLYPSVLIGFLVSQAAASWPGSGHGNPGPP